MKKLLTILLILVSLNLTAQDTTCITMQDVLNYEIECYNDSSIQVLKGYMKFHWGNIIVIPDSVYYVHRKPTFYGFIEYLKKTNN